MSDIIKLLPDSVANQIAAGEVIQRPASVIKELVENAVDAGATSIHIVLKDAGRTLIQVIDDGCGMSDTDARLAFERHSTSKIRQAADLFSLHTMGFRGEALASIAAIAQVELRTCMKGSSIGTKIEMCASKCTSQEPIACPEGSNFMVKNLFFNVPARRKFLKSNQVELSNIIREFERLALVNNDIRFTLVHGNSTLYNLLPGSFKQRITSLLGASLDSQLIPLSVDTSLAKIEGFVCRPEGARRRHFLQYLFANGRHMRHPYFHKTIVACYGRLISSESQPNYFLRFSLDPQSIDVNIHPTKNEIKFENEGAVAEILSAAVKEALGRFSLVPSIDFDSEGAPTIPVFNSATSVSEPRVDVDPYYNPFSSPSGSASHSGWQKLYGNFSSAKAEGGGEENSDFSSVTGEGSKNTDTEDIATGFSHSPWRRLGGINPTVEGGTSHLDSLSESTESYMSQGSQSVTDDEPQPGRLPLQGISEGSFMFLGDCYIASPVAEGLMIIHSGRARMRIFYDNFMSRCGNAGNAVESQRVLFPTTISLSPEHDALMMHVEAHLAEAGFALSRLESGSWQLLAVPQGLSEADAEEVVMQLLDSEGCADDEASQLRTKVYEHIALSVARGISRAPRKSLSQNEMSALVTDLLSRREPSLTPDGQKIITTLSYAQIARLFG